MSQKVSYEFLDDVARKTAAVIKERMGGQELACFPVPGGGGCLPPF